ncbi:MAG: hypothetical protein J6X89_06905 [Bacteroidales bacterium]|nr:hypothetical protein [Bacteroidales bacterium]
MRLPSIIAIIALAVLPVSCVEAVPHSEYWGGVDQMEFPPEEKPDSPSVPESNPDAVAYADLHDAVHDAGQFFLPEDDLRPEVYWYMTYTDYPNRETPNLDGSENTGLQNYLLMQSIAGLVNRACAAGRTKVGIWTEQSGTGYDMERSDYGYQITSHQSAVELATKTYGKWEGYDVTVRDLFDGYVLTDVVHNQESAIAAVASSSVYNAIIVDVRDEAFFIRNGYTKKFDCTTMTTAQAFAQFKDRLSNDALVMMPTNTGELRDYAIQHGLFLFNYNKRYNISGSNNAALFEEILEWLQPHSQVIGWEQGVGEGVFVDPVSKHGHMLVAADWSYNMGITSRHYKDRQSETLARVINPRTIDYDKKSNYLGFFLTDGDNYQWIITDNFVSNYYSLLSSKDVKIAFEMGTQSLTQLAPTRLGYLLGRQPSAECTIMETFGGGYYYIDNYCTAGKAANNRAEGLKVAAERAAAHMRQHGIKILHVMGGDFSSPKAQEMLQAFVDANDQLEGITAVQRDPYDGAGGKIYWFTNKKGYDIPCVTARYMLWNGVNNPTSLATTIQKENQTSQSFSTIAVHAWSEFDGSKAADSVKKCADAMAENFTCVSMQELIWRIRMAERPEQTREYLKTIK